jgi:membrane-associated phospholipid phosphatase
MHWQLIIIAGFVVVVASFLAALFIYSSLRGSRNTGQELRLRTDRAVSRSTTGTDCRG